MTRQLHRLRSERPCDCIACFGFRLAAKIFVAGLAVILLLSALLELDAPTPLLVDRTENGVRQ